MESAVNEPRAITTSDPTGGEPRGQLREWVTPSFEQVALKDALGAPTLKWVLTDSVTHSS